MSKYNYVANYNVITAMHVQYIAKLILQLSHALGIANYPLVWTNTFEYIARTNS